MGAGASYVLCLRPFRGSGSPEKIDVPDRCPKRLATWRVSVVPTGGQSSWPRVRSPWDGKPSRPHVDYTALGPSGLPPRDEKTGARPDLSRFPPRLVPWPRRNASAGDPTPRFEAPEPRDPTSSPRRSAPMGAPSERGGEGTRTERGQEGAPYTNSAGAVQKDGPGACAMNSGGDLLSHGYPP